MHMVRFHAKTKEQAFKTLFSCVLVTGLINFAAIVLLHMVEGIRNMLRSCLQLCFQFVHGAGNLLLKDSQRFGTGLI